MPPQSSPPPLEKGKGGRKARGPFQQFLPAAPITCMVQKVRPEELGQIRLNMSVNEGASEIDITGFTARKPHGDTEVIVLGT